MHLSNAGRGTVCIFIGYYKQGHTLESPCLGTGFEKYTSRLFFSTPQSFGSGAIFSQAFWPKQKPLQYKSVSCSFQITFSSASFQLSFASQQQGEFNRTLACSQLLQ